MEKLLAGEVTVNSPVSDCSDTSFKHVTSCSSVGQAARIVQNNDYVFVVDNNQYRRTLHRQDILDFVAKQ